MPYKSTEDLPDPVRKHLPPHAQEIYREAFNNAYEEYADPKKRRAGSSQRMLPTVLPGLQLKRCTRRMKRPESGRESNRNE